MLGKSYLIFYPHTMRSRYQKTVFQVFDLVADKCGYDTLCEAHNQLSGLVSGPSVSLERLIHLEAFAPTTKQLRDELAEKDFQVFMNYYTDINEPIEAEMEEYFEECHYYNHRTGKGLA